MSDSNIDEQVNISVDSQLIGRILSIASAGFNDQNSDVFTSVMHDDVEIFHSAFPGVVRGRDSVKRLYESSFWTAFPDMTLELLDGPFFHLDSPRVVVEWLVKGTHLARLEPQGLAATGQRMEVTAREILEIRDGRIQSIDIKIDMGQAFRQLGVLPQEGSNAEKLLLFLQGIKTKLASIMSGASRGKS